MNGRSRHELQDDVDLLASLLAEEGIHLSAASSIPARPDRHNHRLSFAQQRLWTLYHLYPGSRCAYNIVLAVTFAGDFNPAALEASLNQIISRHEVLRSRLISELGVPRVRVLQAAALHIPVIDLRGEPEAAQRAALSGLIETENQHVFDLEQVPLIRVSLVRTRDTEYAAVLNLHHLIGDAWSMGILLRELAQLYDAHLSGVPAALPRLRIQYGDFAEWQRTTWEDGRLAEQLEYWTKQLAGPCSLELPAGRSALNKVTFAGSTRPFAVPLAVTSALKDLGRHTGATLFMTLLAAFNVLLYRYTAQTDIIVGTPVANRTRREIEPLIGFFVNSLALRCRTSAAMTFRSLLRQVRDTALAAYAAQDVPFDQIVRELAPDRDGSVTPLSQVMFSLEDGREAGLSLSGVTLCPLPVETTTSKFDLTLALTDGERGLSGGFEYSAELFDSSTIDRMVEHFSLLLHGIVETPDLPISALPMLSRREQDLVVLKWNRTARDYPANASIVDVFEAQVARSSDRTALEFGDERVCYRELNTRADQFAHTLRSAGLRLEECVGVCMDPSVDMVVAVIGILKAGGVYVPINRVDPGSRIRAIAVETRMRFVVGERAYDTVLPHNMVETIYADRHSSGAAAPPDAPRPDGATLAYINYTSGSTGEPKGIAIPHRAVVRLVLNTDYVVLDPSDRVAQVSTFTFDAFTFELWGALLNGASLVGVNRETALSPTRLGHFLAGAQITTLFLTTALFNEIVQADPDAFAPLRQLLFGGEAVDPARVADVLGSRKPQRLLHVYGPTETTTFATWFLVEHVSRDARTVPIGEPIANTEAYVLDDLLRPVPVGVPGELYLGGDGLARGYWTQPSLTADKFRPHPFDRRPGRRLYKSGDWVRRLPTGAIEFLGRMDQQVKIRGFRVELAAIETALLRHPGVRQAAVRSHRHEGHHRLVAYVVSDAEFDNTGAELLASLRDLLPSYMIPAQIVYLHQLPMTPGGKVDRKRLPTPDAPVGRSHDYVEPRSPNERLLAEVWQDVLSLPTVGVNDNYLELGGDSITAIQIASRVRRRGWEVEPGEIVRRPTIAALAPRLRPLAAEEETRVPVTGPVPLAPIQRWFFDSHRGDLHHFNQSVLLKCRNRLDTAALEAALRALQEHHDALRMTYAVDAHVEQINAGLDHPFVLEVVDLTGETSPAMRLESHATQLQASLTLRDGPLMKSAVYRLDDGDRLLLIVHHLVIDLLSWRILLEDLDTAYQQRLGGGGIDLGAKTESYRRWTEEVTRFSISPELMAEIDYWSKDLDAPAIVDALTGSIPLDPVTAGEGANLFADSEIAHTTLPEGDTRELLTGVHHAFNTEVNDVMLTAFARALRLWNGGSRTWITLEGHGREPLARPLNLTRTIGWFTSLHPFLLELRGEDPGTQLCEVKESLRRVPRKGVGYGILRYVTPDRPGIAFDISAPEISFNYAGQFGVLDGRSWFELAEESVGPAISPRLARQHALDVSSIIVNGKLEISFAFNRKRYAITDIERLLSAYVAELSALAAYCRRRSESEKTPADFIATRLSLEGYHRFLEAHGWNASDIDDVYPLAPMQEGMLFQHLFDATSDAYFIQTVCRIDGALDPHAFRESWRYLSQRHAALRTAFVYEDLPRPLQVVFKERAPEITLVDLRGRTDAEQSEQCAAYEARDRQRRFDLQHDPPMRLTLLRLTDTTSHLIWAYPHIILDGWCVGIIYTEFLEVYRAFANGGRLALPPAARYRDFIDWLESQDVEAARAYWTNVLDGYQTAVTPGRGALVKPSSVGEWRVRTFDIPAAVCARARQVATDLSVTLNTIVQTAWGLVLSRYNDSRDVVFGTIVAGRPPELARMDEAIGVFINAIPIRIRYGRDQSVAQVLAQVQHAALDSERFQHLPLVEILARTACGRGLFDHLLVFENYPVGRQPPEERGPGSLSVQFLASQDRTHYDFDLAVVPGDPIQVQIGYSTASYDDRQIERTAAHLERAIAGMVRDPTQAIDRVDILPGWERDAVLFGCNATEQKLPEDRTWVDMFEDQARRRPEAIAASDRDCSLTYRELSQRVDQLARRLAELGVGPEVLVAINVERSLDMVVGLLAVLKAGGGYLPIDTAAASERLAFILADAKPSLLLTRGTLSETLPGDIQRIYLDDDTTHSTAPFASRAQADSLAYVIYTSGTTGPPKGVMVAHRSLLNGARAWQRYYGLDTFEVRMLQIAPFSSDVFTGDVIRCLTSGGALTICPPDVRADPAALHELLATHEISIFESTPALIVPLMDYLYESRLPHWFLKLLIAGSDTLPAAQYRRLVERFGGSMRIINSYGVTEATIESSCFEESRDSGVVIESEENAAARGNRPTPVGRPLANIRYFVRDRDGRALPIGFPGELQIGGDGVARGYLSRPALTAERFVPDPIYPGERLYKSGDLVRWLPDGNLEFIGRTDRQVKIRGHRIELGEIEYWLQRLPTVRHAIVTLIDHGPDDRELVAYLVHTERDADLDNAATQETRRRAVLRVLNTQLPEYMVPRHIVELPTLPLTAHGKLDFAALPEPDRANGNQRSGTIARDLSSSAEQRALETMWEEVLRVRGVTGQDNFFELGGHSLKAMQLISRVQKHLGVRISYQEFFERPTFEALSALVAAAGEASPATGEPDPASETRNLGVPCDRQPLIVDPGALATALPQAPSRSASWRESIPSAIPQRAPATSYGLSHAQKRLWLLHQLEGHAAYNMPEAVLLEDDLDVGALSEAFTTLIQRHEALRTAFMLIDGEPRQVIREAVPFSIDCIDVGDAADPEMHARQRAAAEAVKPFDLGAPPLLRATLFRLAPHRQVFLLVMHHIIGDGWSMNVLHQEVLTLYASYRQGRRNPLPPLRIQYADYAVWQNGRDFTADEQYWLGVLAGVPERLRLPFDSAPDAQRDFTGHNEELRLSAAATAHLKGVARAHRTTLSNVVLALFQLVLYRWTNQSDICVGLSMANRTHADLEHLVGFFVNVLPIRVRLSAAMEFAELLAQVDARTTEALDHQDYPFDRLIEALNPGRVGNRQPLVNVLYAFQNFHDVAIELGHGEGLLHTGPTVDATAPRIRAFAVPFETSKFDLTLFASDDAEALLLTLEYDTQLFRPETMRRCLSWIDRFAGLVT